MVDLQYISFRYTHNPRHFSVDYPKVRKVNYYARFKTSDDSKTVVSK